MMISKDIANLLAGKKLDVLSPEEELRLEQWRQESELHETAYQYALNRSGWYADLQLLETMDVDAAVGNVLQRIHRPKSKKRVWLYWAYAGVAASLLLAVMLWLGHYGAEDRPILPGGNKALLTLADGTAVQLSESQHEIVISDELLYGDGSSLQGAGAQVPDVGFMEITTPKGGEYTVVLSDKTKIVLNAASKLRFPKHFAETERLVELEGEAYFEVNKQQLAGHKPKAFLVKTAQQVVRVLGTQFNVSAYAEEGYTYTTLVEGKVRVTTPFNPEGQQVLMPGQQASNKSGGALEVKSVDVFNYIAWTQNQFVFASEPLESVMQKVARWYDLDYKFDKESLKQERIEGILPRYASVKDLLDLLAESGGMRFRLDNKTVHIY